jgi:hypothetical protein
MVFPCPGADRPGQAIKAVDRVQKRNKTLPNPLRNTNSTSINQMSVSVGGGGGGVGVGGGGGGGSLLNREYPAHSPTYYTAASGAGAYNYNYYNNHNAQYNNIINNNNNEHYHHQYSGPAMSRLAMLSTTELAVRREIAIMKKCHHKHVVRLREVIDDRLKKKIYLGEQPLSLSLSFLFFVLVFLFLFLFLLRVRVCVCVWA